jgi:Holliday junction resolvasome RuvABC endonuclease subunit
MIRALGIDMGDPGGAVVVELDEQFRLAHYERLSGVETVGAGLLRKAESLIEAYRPHIVAVEKAWTGPRDPRPSVGLAQAEKQALVKAACQSARVRFLPIYASSIRAAVRHAVRGKGPWGKVEHGRAVRGLLRLQSDDEHVADAGGIAMVAAWRCPAKKPRSRKVTA